MKEFTTMNHLKNLVIYDDVVKQLSEKNNPYKDFVEKCNEIEPFTTSIHMAEKFKISHDDLMENIERVMESDEMKKESRKALSPQWCVYLNKSGIMIPAARMNRGQFDVVLQLSGCFSNVTHEQEILDYFEAFKKAEKLLRKEIEAEIRVLYFSSKIKKVMNFFSKFKLI